MDTFAVLPLETVRSGGLTYRGPKYLKWVVRGVTGTGTIACDYTMSEYSANAAALFYLTDLNNADGMALASRPDAVLLSDLDTPVTDGKVIAALAGVNGVRSEWLAEPTTYRQLLVYLAELFNGAKIIGRGRL